MITAVGQIGGLEIVLIIAAIVVIFGATQIPKIARSLGEGLKEFKKAVKEAKEDDDDGEQESSSSATSRKKTPAKKQ